MAAESEHEPVRFPGGTVRGGVAGSLAGFAAGLAGGFVVQAANPTVVAEAMPALLGLAGAGLALGWVVHLVVSVAFGAIYGAALERTTALEGIDAVAGLRRRARDPFDAAFLGAGYGVLLWIAVAVVGMPVVLSAVGYAAAPAVPYLEATALGAFAFFGVVVGLVYALVAGR